MVTCAHARSPQSRSITYQRGLRGPHWNSPCRDHVDDFSVLISVYDRMGTVRASDGQRVWSCGLGPLLDPVWTVILLVVSVVSVSLALRHVIHDGGLLGTTGLLVSVPVGTSLYREFVTRYPDISGAALECSDVTVYYPIGYNLFSSQQPHWMDVVVLVGLLGVVFLLGRWIATSKRHTRDRLVVSVLFLGTILYWYLDPIPFRRDMYMAPSPYMMQFVGEGI